jgi:F-type H+-transporting ATPase subunit epsilon
MANCFRLCVQTAEGVVLEGAAEYCNLLTADGSVGILANHAPMLCAVREGTALFRMENGEEKRLRLSAGVADIRNNTVTVLADRAES